MIQHTPAGIELPAALGLEFRMVPMGRVPFSFSCEYKKDRFQSGVML